jgi:molybdopterin molybdotransferase
LISPTEADAAIQLHVTCLPIESLPLAQCHGAVLRENIYAERDQPPFDRVAMDGIAVASAALAGGARSLRVAGTQAAGSPQMALERPDDCIEVMTGAVLPRGCDCVVPVEKIEVAHGSARLAEPKACTPDLNVHKRGSDSRQGELLVAAGSRLRAAEIAVAASAGMARVRVSSQPAIMVISTGDELIDPGEPITDYQVRRSNSYGIAAMLRDRGFTRVGDDHLLDDPELLRRRLRLHLDTHDALILSGGVSMGRFDLVPRALDELGVREVFHRVAQRPGRPMWFGVGPRGQAVFGLPGNPVSTLVCLTRYVLPALNEAMGLKSAAPEKIALATVVEHPPALTGFLPVKLEVDDWGRTWAVPRPTNGSGDFVALVGTDGFVELPPGPNTYAKGFVTRLHRW